MTKSPGKPVNNRRDEASRGKRFLFIGAAYGALAVGLGAFGAHAMKGRFSPEELAIYQTAVTYQFIHASVLVALGVFLSFQSSALLGAGAWLFSMGIFFFSGSLYLLSIGAPTFVPPKIGWVTPIGGLLLLSAWVMVALYAVFRK